ncbi:MAG: AMP-binding protein [Candidatus Lokiarchaeota archaeon]|nr:AMP-binding protein [Candidatus Lokiarchaeota archaeon]
MKFEKLEFERYPSIPALFLKTVEKFPDKICFQYYRDYIINNPVEKITFREYKELVVSISSALLEYGFDSGDHLAIFAESTHKWCISDVAILALGACTVTVFPTLAYEQVRFILDDSDSKGVFVSTKQNLIKILKVWEKDLPDVKLLVVFDDISDLDLSVYFSEEKRGEFREKILGFEEIIEIGRTHYKKQPDAIADKIRLIKEDDLASIIYTSGTTGVPKGVMLSHKNILSDVMLGAITVHPDPNEVSVTYLPLSHSFTRTVEHFGMILYGATLSFAVDHDTLQEAMLQFKPTSMIGVPYVFETMLKMIRQKVAEMGEKAEKIFWNAVDVGKRIQELKQQVQKIPLGLKIKYFFLKTLILSQIRKNFGGRIRHFLSGSAPLNPQTAKFFHAVDVPIYEGYGLTEASPVTHTNTGEPLTNVRPPYRFGKVGPLIGHDKFGSTHPYEPLEQRLSEIGELLIAGPNIMKGYYKRPEETAQALEEKDGKIWLHTGDLATIDEDGYVKIVGRAKQIIVLKTGKKVAPNLVEPIYEEHPFVHQVMLLGEGEKFIGALVVPNLDYKGKICENCNLGLEDDTNVADFLKNEQVIGYFDEILKDIEKDRLSHYETIKKFALVEEFTEEEGLLSPTLKLKRKKIYEKYHDKINELYHS